ncbi:amidohydrolase family protein [Gordonia sp. (in: high G+C Gram-positive bacteria)]|jgi:predicted TIM-barrel fold metal-dependent hydrolase|uniref:amidohydrolase family protein n=1 Tax=Gordonia sp. (in: high G+C Gram-positive bacteria) TaxID=84139 RepID=UPI001D6F6CA4|nr:amidohydrolase family protein [Gordonia sp. (in: high G+C Gram-positive bacteria)]MCB1297306.1 amidohydrolase family protein [Gordonia sp. (in: high G+C Gram-positive bacteria)]HMS74887.1 amidohydrolase family protein [Gordonia sp. (in: high G+C Gram-positive bacteria)]HQV19461.1 amidohydrolase family protein [Gordonia sp. (in: high G+C Gram-positive bacteria)]
MALIENSVGTLPYLMTDFDQHCYEATDAFTRFMPANKLHTAVRPVKVPGYDRKVLLANDKIVTALENDLDQAYVPGSLVEMLKQRASGDNSDSDRFYEPIQEEYLNKDKRLVQLKEQQIEKAIMYPGGWALLAEAYLDGIDPLYDNLRAFNRWIDEDWGFSYHDTIYAPALLSLRDLDRSVEELEKVLDAGARFLLLPAGPAYGRSPGDPYFDPFWARVNEAKAVVCYHISEFYYQSNVAADWGWGLVPPFQFSAWQWQNSYGERPVTDTLSALIFDNLFGRFPNIKVLVSEFGAEWIPHFIRHMDKSRGMARNGRWLGGQLTERPSTVFKKHIRVVPYPEDDTIGMVEKLGTTECLLMGSDWPHAEGLREPADFYTRVEGLGEENRRLFLRENGINLIAGT